MLIYSKCTSWYNWIVWSKFHAIAPLVTHCGGSFRSEPIRYCNWPRLLLLLPKSDCGLMNLMQLSAASGRCALAWVFVFVLASVLGFCRLFLAICVWRFCARVMRIYDIRSTFFWAPSEVWDLRMHKMPATMLVNLLRCCRPFLRLIVSRVCRWRPVCDIFL